MSTLHDPDTNFRAWINLSLCLDKALSFMVKLFERKYSALQYGRGLPDVVLFLMLYSVQKCPSVMVNVA